VPATKDEIAARFFQHVVHYGLAKTSVEEVARELGVSKRTVYQYFGSKDEIFRYVVEKYADETVERIGRQYAAIPSRWERLEKLVRELVLQATRDWLTRFEGTELRHQFEFGVRVNRQAYDALIRRWVAEGAEAGEFHPIAGDAGRTARFIGALLQDATEQIREDRGSDVDDAVVEAVHKLLA
jgi:AcrR family transcriptional regulator